MMAQLAASRSLRLSLLSSLLCILFFAASTFGANQYAIHLNVPLSDPSQDPVQLQQWIAAAHQAAADLTTSWQSSSGDSIQVDVMDNQGDIVITASNAITSATNASVIALVSAGPDTLTDQLELTARSFSLAVVSATSRTTALPSHSGSTFLSMATAQSFDATALLAGLEAQGFDNLAVLQDMSDASIVGVAQAFLNLPLRISAHLEYTGAASAQSCLQRAMSASATVLVMVSSNYSNILPFIELGTTMGYIEAGYSVLDGVDASIMANLSNGALLLDVVDANQTVRTAFSQRMASLGWSAYSQTLRHHAIHTYDAVMAIGRAIEASSVGGPPATRSAVTSALFSSDYVGLSGNMSLDSRGFRLSGYLQELNNQYNTSGASSPSSNSTASLPLMTVATWTYEQGILTTLTNTTYSGGTTKKPNADVTYYGIGLIDSYALINPTPLYQYVVDLVNRDNANWMPTNTQLYLLPYDDGFTVTGAVQASLYEIDYAVTGVFGPLTSTLTLASQNVLGPFKIPQLSSTATNPSLSDKTSYPTFLRNIQSDDLQGNALVALVRHFGWTHIGIISSTDPYSTGLAQTVVTASASTGVTILSQIALDSNTADPVAAVKTVKNSGARVLLLLTQNPTWTLVIQSILAADYHPEAVLSTDSIMSLGFASLVNLTGAPPDFFNGWVTTNPPSGQGQFWQDFQAGVAALGPQADVLYPGLTPFLASGLTYIPLMADAVYIYADAIKRCLADGKGVRDGSNLLDYMYATNITLNTGLTYFDDSGDRLGPFDIYNILNGTAPLVARFDYTAAATGGYSLGAGYSRVQDIIWPSGTTTVPMDVIPRVPTWLRWSSGGGIVMAVLAIVGLLLVLLTFVVIIWQRKSPVIASSTWEFLVVMLVGIALGYGSMFTWIGEPNAAACGARIWLPPLAFTFIMAPLLAKTWRLHRIFTLGSLKIVPIRLWKLIVFASVLILIQVLICGFWIGFGSVTPITINDPTNVEQSFVLCEQLEANRIATWVTFGFNGFCMLVGAYYAFRVRNLPKEFNESRFIGFAMYNSLLSGILIIILGYSLGGFPVTVQILICICTWIIATGSISFMMLPKLWTLWIHPEKRSSSARTSNTGNNASSKAGELSSISAPPKRHNYSRNPTTITSSMSRTNRSHNTRESRSHSSRNHSKET